ncbi:hypothetical protein K1719_022766 [Acacia pycnantha]|nr:hypothetical protein K1719_022766 [Acacia pycnantha]
MKVKMNNWGAMEATVVLAMTVVTVGQGDQVRCSSCRMILMVAPGLTEFACPSCRMPQMLPPELMSRAHQKPSQQSHVPAHGIDPTKIQLPCASCKAILNVLPGLARLACPQCGVDLAIERQLIDANLSSSDNWRSNNNFITKVLL